MIELRWVTKRCEHIYNEMPIFSIEKVLQYRTSATVKHGAGLSTVIQSEWQDVPVVDESN